MEGRAFAGAGVRRAGEVLSRGGAFGARGRAFAGSEALGG